jgi:hypothetical protein
MLSTRPPSDRALIDWTIPDRREGGGLERVSWHNLTTGWLETVRAHRWRDHCSSL